MIGSLSKSDVHNLFNWLREKKINYDPCRLHRDFSDCVKVAKLLHRSHPRLVEMNNYPKRNSTALKINNWETLNFKVLSKIGLSLNSKCIDNLANGKPGAIERVLWRIMKKEMENSRKRDKKMSDQEKFWVSNDDVVYTKVRRVVDGSIVECNEKLILYSIYDDARRDACLLSKQIAAREQEIAHLERLSALKAEHLAELTDRLRRYDSLGGNGGYGYGGVSGNGSEVLDLSMSEGCVPYLDLKQICNTESRSLPGSVRTKKGSHSY